MWTIIGSVGKESASYQGDLGSIPGWGGSPGEGNINLLQYSGLENPMDRGAGPVTVPRIAESDMTVRLSLFTLKLGDKKMGENIFF